MPDHALSLKLLNNLPALCNMVRRVAIDAGEITLDYYDGGAKACGVYMKDDGSPVTLADQEAEAFIGQRLSEITPGVPMVGEEAIAAGRRPDLTGHDYFWLVDALDGTKEFIAGDVDFTVNIALIHKGQPVLGVVYLPATGILYAGCGEGTAIQWSDERHGGGDRSISVRPAPQDGLVVMTSRSHGDESKLQDFLSGFKVKKIIRRGSSLKICTVAEGRADLYPRLGPTCEWDIAAAHAVLSSAGGVLTDLSGIEFTYGHTDRNMLNTEFVAASVNWLEDINDD